MCARAQTQPATPLVIQSLVAVADNSATANKVSPVKSAKQSTFIRRTQRPSYIGGTVG